MSFNPVIKVRAVQLTKVTRVRGNSPNVLIPLSKSGQCNHYEVSKEEAKANVLIPLSKSGQCNNAKLGEEQATSVLIPLSKSGQCNGEGAQLATLCRGFNPVIKVRAVQLKDKFNQNKIIASFNPVIKVRAVQHVAHYELRSVSFSRF